MATKTRSDGKAAFNHVLDNVLGRGDSSELKKALLAEGIENIFDLITIEDTTIDSLTFKDTSNAGAPITIKKGDRNLLKCFGAYKRFLDEAAGDINYVLIMQEDFDQFRIGPACVASAAISTLSSPSRTSAPIISKPAPTPAENFKRGIKRDTSVFPTLKDEKFHDLWHRSFANQARAQDVSDVIDASYVPTTPEDIALFTEKQKYLYAVLETKVLTDRGKAIIRDHENDFDAQEVYKQLQAHHLKSTRAMIESSTILSYITSVRLGDGTWTSTTEGFITHWQNQIRLYEKHVPTTDHFSEGQKRTMLQNAVHSINELRQVKNNADLLSTQGGVPLTYDEYTNLLMAAASAYDAQYQPQKARRQVFNHFSNDINDHEDDYGNLGIDSPVTSLQAFATHPINRRGGNSIRMPRDKWFNLDDDSKAIWDQLDDKAKAVILGYTPNERHTALRPANSHNPSFGRPPFRPQAHLHEISAYDYLQAYTHTTILPPVDDSPQPSTTTGDLPDTPAEETLLINAAKSFGQQSLPPGDVRRVMSQKSTRFEAHLTELRVSFQQSMDRIASLIDRGANGGVAGDDVRVIFKTSRMVDIKGIDNHLVNDINIGTVGGIVQTQKGPVIAIMHQYALFGKGASIHSACQMEWYKNDVNDKSIHVPGGMQRIKTLEGYIIPSLSIKDGLARLDIRPYTDKEYDSLPHVFLTSELEWDPSAMDHCYDTDTQWGDEENCTDFHLFKHYDEFGDYRRRVSVNTTYFHRQDGHQLEDVIDQCILHSHPSPPTDIISICQAEASLNQPILINKKDPDFNKLRPLFGWLSPDVIQKDF